MLKTFVSGLLLSSGLIVGVGASSVAPEAQLPMKERLSRRIEQTYTPQSAPDARNYNTPQGGGASRRVALTGESSSKIRPGSFGRTSLTGGAPSALPDAVGGHNWFPDSYLAGSLLAGFAGTLTTTGYGAGGSTGFSTVSGNYILSGDNGNIPYLGLPYYANTSSDDGNVKNDGSGSITDKDGEVPVPEPSTFAILGTGFLTLCYVFYRKQKKAAA